MQKTRLKQEVIRYLFMILSSGLFALGMGCFLAQHTIVSGGVTGIGIVVNKFTSLPIGAVSLACNIPIILFAWRYMGRRFTIDCLIMSALLSAMIDAVAGCPLLTDDKLMASLYGGLSIGISVGINFRYMLNGGGTELLARVLRRFKPFRDVHMGMMLGVTDGVIVVISAILLKDPQNVLYALIVIGISSKVSDLVISGFDYAKLCYIITDKPETVSKMLLQHLPRGVTLLDGTGMYTGKRRGVLLTVVKKRDFTVVKEIVSRADEGAFVIISEATQVMGKGFHALDDEENL